MVLLSMQGTHNKNHNAQENFQSIWGPNGKDKNMRLCFSLVASAFYVVGPILHAKRQYHILHQYHLSSILFFGWPGYPPCLRPLGH